MDHLIMYCFNDIEPLYRLLNGVVMFMQSDGFKVIIYIAMAVAMFLGLARAFFHKDPALALVLGILMPLIIFMGLLRESTTLLMVDEFSLTDSGAGYSVDDVPLGLALPLWISSNLEKYIVDLFDETIRPVETPAMKKVDFFGHARLMSEVAASNVWTGHPVYQTTVEFIKNCVYPQLSLYTLSLDTLKRSPNIYSAVATGNNMYFTKYFSPDPNCTSNCIEILGCGTVYNLMLTDAHEVLNSTDTGTPLQRLNQVFGYSGTNAALAANSYDAILGSLFAGRQDSMEALMLQNLLINGIRGAVTETNPALSAAMAESDSRYYTTATVAGMNYVKMLPTLRAFFLMITVALFPVICCFFLFMMGKPFLNWCGCIFWVSLWLPMEAIIHSVYGYYTISNLKNMTDAIGGYSYANSLPILKWANETTAIAGGLMILIPMISGLVIRWITPQIGSALSGFMMASRGLGTGVEGAARDAVPNASQRMLGLDTDEKYLKDLAIWGDRDRNAANMVKQLNNTFQGSPGMFGDSAVQTLSEGGSSVFGSIESRDMNRGVDASHTTGTDRKVASGNSRDNVISNDNGWGHNVKVDDGTSNKVASERGSGKTDSGVIMNIKQTGNTFGVNFTDIDGHDISGDFLRNLGGGTGFQVTVDSAGLVRMVGTPVALQGLRQVMNNSNNEINGGDVTSDDKGQTSMPLIGAGPVGGKILSSLAMAASAIRVTGSLEGHSSQSFSYGEKNTESTRAETREQFDKGSTTRVQTGDTFSASFALRTGNTTTKGQQVSDTTNSGENQRRSRGQNYSDSNNFLTGSNVRSNIAATHRNSVTAAVAQLPYFEIRVIAENMENTYPSLYKASKSGNDSLTLKQLIAGELYKTAQDGGFTEQGKAFIRQAATTISENPVLSSRPFGRAWSDLNDSLGDQKAIIADASDISKAVANSNVDKNQLDPGIKKKIGEIKQQAIERGEQQKEPVDYPDYVKQVSDNKYFQKFVFDGLSSVDPSDWKLYLNEQKEEWNKYLSNVYNAKTASKEAQFQGFMEYHSRIGIGKTDDAIDAATGAINQIDLRNDLSDEPKKLESNIANHAKAVFKGMTGGGVGDMQNASIRAGKFKIENNNTISAIENIAENGSAIGQAAAAANNMLNLYDNDEDYKVRAFREAEKRMEGSK